MTARLLFDSISRNTGDIAIGIAAEQVLAARGIRTAVLDPFVDADATPLLIGGGELIRDTGDDFYDRFRRTGNHILNAAGVWQSAGDLDYLREYRFVSARSEFEVDHLRQWVPEAQLLPCTTTLLTSPHYEINGIEPDEPVVGIHVVPHALRLLENLVELINTIPHKKIFIPFTHYNGDASFMRSLPFDWNNTIVLENLKPLELHSVIGQMRYVLVSSLHASIFAYSQGVGFGSIHQPKAENYFRDRGLSDFMIRDENSLRDIVDRLEHDGFDAARQLMADKAAVNDAYDEFAMILQGAASSIAPRSSASARERRDRVLLTQSERVIADRDLALAIVERRRQAVSALNQDLSHKLSQKESDLNALRSLWWVRLGTRAVRLLRRARAHLPGVLKRPGRNRS
jgi:hypothetical protein